MNKFLTHEGLMPIWLGDINYMTKSGQEALALLAKALLGGVSSAVLYGCEITSSSSQGIFTIKWTDGIVMLDGEILPIKAGTERVTSGVTPYMVISQSYDPTGKRMLKNGTEVECYELREATIVRFVTGDTPKWSPTNLPRLDDALRRIVPPISQLIYKDILTSESDQIASGISKMVVRLYKEGDAYYLQGDFRTASSLNVGILYDSVYKDLPAELVGADVNPGITSCMVAISSHDSRVDTMPDKLLPAKVTITQDDSLYSKITLQVLAGSSIGELAEGSFCVRLNV